jgi:hypothetical protein
MSDVIAHELGHAVDYLDHGADRVTIIDLGEHGFVTIPSPPVDAGTQRQADNSLTAAVCGWAYRRLGSPGIHHVHWRECLLDPSVSESDREEVRQHPPTDPEGVTASGVALARLLRAHPAAVNAVAERIGRQGFAEVDAGWLELLRAS